MCVRGVCREIFSGCSNIQMGYGTIIVGATVDMLPVLTILIVDDYIFISLMKTKIYFIIILILNQ